MKLLPKFGIGAVLVFLLSLTTGRLTDATANAAQKEPKKAKDQDTAAYIGGIVVGADGKAVAGAAVELKGGRAPGRALSQSDGKFQMTVADAPMFGFVLLARSADGERLACLHVPGSKVKADFSALRLVLKPAQRLNVTVVDGKGQPLPGVRAGAMSEDLSVVAESLTDGKGRVTLRMPADSPIRSVFAWKRAAGFDYQRFEDSRDLPDRKPPPPPPPPAAVTLKLEGARTLRVTVLNGDRRPIPKLLLYPWYLEKSDDAPNFNLSGAADIFRAITDEHGVATWDWLPVWQKTTLEIWPRSEDHAHRRLTWEPRDDTNTATLILDRLQPVRGCVTHADGSPAAGIVVRTDGSGYDHDGYRGDTKTDAQGKYELRVPPYRLYLLVVNDAKWSAEPQTGFAVLPKTPVPDKDFVLRPVTVIRGRVTVGKGKEEKPYAGQELVLRQKGVDSRAMPNALPNPEKSRSHVQPSLGHLLDTDADGRFEFRVGPGTYQLHGNSQIKPVKITVTDQKLIQINLHATRVETGRLTGLVVVGAPPTPVANALLKGLYREFPMRGFAAKTGADGRFDGQRRLHGMVLHARHPDGKQAGVVEIGPEDTTVTLKLAKLASAQGRLVDGETGLPLAGRKLHYGVTVSVRSPNSRQSSFYLAFGGRVATDSAGRFELKGLVAGQKYAIDLELEKNEGLVEIHSLVPAAGELVKIGDLKLTPEPKPKTAAEIRRAAFDGKGTPLERFETARRDAVLSRQHVLVIFAAPDEAAAAKLFALVRERNELREELHDFRTIWIATDGDRLPAAQALAEKLKSKFSGGAAPLLVVANAKGEVLASSLQKDGQLDAPSVRQFLAGAAPEHLNAEKLLADALAQAKKENKRVLVQETATWCAPCWRLSRFLEQQRSIWQKDYIWVKMDQRWTKADKVMAPIRNKAEGGIPWTAILDAEGKVLATSNSKDGQNIGFPSDANGIAHFATMFRSTALRLTPQEITGLAKALKVASRP